MLPALRFGPPRPSTSIVLGCLLLLPPWLPDSWGASPAAKPASAAAKPRDYAEYGENLGTETKDRIQAAEEGDLEAGAWLADALIYGEGGITPDGKKALSWFLRLAEKGDPQTMLSLASFNERGFPEIGLAVDPVAALAWYKRAAETGWPQALTSLGAIYGDGDPNLGVTRDDAEGFKWYQRAADVDDAIGQYHVGLYYAEGRGVKKDLAKAKEWLGRASAQGYSDADELLAKIAPPPPPESPWAKFAKEFETAFNAARGPEAREQAVGEFSRSVGYNANGATKAQMSEFVLTTLKPYLERNVGESGAYILAINSLVFEKDDVARLLPANVQASIKAHAQQTVAKFEKSQKLAAELRQLEDAARNGPIPQKIAVADRYLREAQANAEDRPSQRVRALYWLIQARSQGDTARGELIKTLEQDYAQNFARYLATGAGWKAYYLADGMSAAGYGRAAKDAGMVMLLGQAGAAKMPAKAKENFDKAVSLGDASARPWAAFAAMTGDDATKAAVAFKNADQVKEKKDGQEPDWRDVRRWFEVAASLGHKDAAGQIKLLDDVTALAKAAQAPGRAEFDAGYQAYKAKDYPKALEQWKAAAAKGHADAMYNLGYLYDGGSTFPEDLELALDWYKKSLAAGSAPAKEAIARVEKLFATGYREFALGNAAYNQKAYDDAFRQYTLAEGKGNVGAKFNLGVLALNGFGTTQSLVVARDWFMKAKAAGQAEADKMIAQVEEVIAQGGQDGLDGVAAYRAEKYPEALRLLTIAANKGDGYGAYFLGVYHEEGKAGKKDRAQAVGWYDKSAELGYAEGKNAAAAVRAELVGAAEFDQGKAAYDAKKYTEAVTWYEKAANLGNVRAMAALGSLYQNGVGEIFDDRDKAKFWLRKAVAKGDQLSGIMLQSIESTDYLAAMVVRAKEPPAKGPSLVKGSKWTGDEIIAALRNQVDQVSLAIALRTDGAELYYGDRLAIEQDPAAAAIVPHGRLSEALASADKPVGGAWAWELAKAAIAARRKQVTMPPWPSDSAELRAKATQGDPVAAYALFLMPEKNWKLGKPEGALARSYQQMATFALERNYAPALWVAADMRVNQVDKTKNDPVLQAEYLRRSAEAGDARGAHKYAQLFFAPGDEVGVAPNLAEAELWFIEAGAREQPDDFTIMKPDFALALLYSLKLPIGFQGMEASANESTLRWAQEMIRRGGPGGEHAKRVVESWRRGNNGGAARVAALEKEMKPEVPLWTTAELAKWDATARGGDVAAALKLGAALASGRGARQNDARAVEYYRLAAGKGSTVAMRALAVHAAKGWGVKKDVADYLAWLEKAGAAGDASAWAEVGDVRQFASIDGGKSADNAKALVAYEKAVAGGHDAALFNLSILYEMGRGVPKDPAKMIELLTRAAEKGHVGAMARLGYKLQQTKDFAASATWYEKAVAAGDSGSVRSLAQALESLGKNDAAIARYQEWVAKNPDDFQSFYALGELKEKKGDFRAAIESYRRVEKIDNSFNTFRELGKNSAERLEEELNPKPGSAVALRQLAEKGDVEAMMQYAIKIAPTNRPGALEWVKKAAAKEHPQAMLTLGLETAQTDKAAGLALVEKAATAGNAEAKFRLGGLLIQGKELPMDAVRGVQLVTEAAELNFAPALLELGRALVVGTPFVASEPARGIDYLKKAAMQRVPQAAMLLGEIYEKSIGTPADPMQALRFYEEAARGGIKEANDAVARVRKNSGATLNKLKK